MLGWVWKLLNVFVSSSSKWWQILQFCLRCSFGLQAWKRGEEKKQLSHLFWILSEMMTCCLQFFPTNVTLTHMEISHTLYLLVNLSLTIKPNNMSLDFLSNSKAWWGGCKILSNKVRFKYGNTFLENLLLKNLSASPKLLSHFFPFLLDSIKTNKWFLE